MRPSAVRVLISRRICSRLRMVSATVSSNDRQVATDLTLDLDRLRRPRQIAALHAFGRIVSASSTARPRRTSVNTRWSSACIGLADLLRNRLQALHEREPARNELASSVSASGSCRSKCAVRPFLRCSMYAIGSKKRHDERDECPDRPDEHQDQERGQDREGRHVEHDLAGTNRQRRLLEVPFDPLEDARALGEPTGELHRLLHDRGFGTAVVRRLRRPRARRARTRRDAVRARAGAAPTSTRGRDSQRRAGQCRYYNQ